LNIAIDARDAMPPGGTLVIETANIRAGSGELPEEVAGEDCVLVAMRDTGTGMSREVMERAFEPFFTTKEIGKETGLGLSMVVGVVRQSGGTICLRSGPGEGTTVQIYLPRAIEAATPRSERAVKAQPIRGARILIVDEDPDLRWIMTEYLRKIGHVVREAATDRHHARRARHPGRAARRDRARPRRRVGRRRTGGDRRRHRPRTARPRAMGSARKVIRRRRRA
jgi:CheY-like chemotaxis protein